MPPRVKIDFYYDIGSPYSFVAFEILQRYKKPWNLDLNLRPVLLGGIFKSTGNASPVANPYKARDMLGALPRIFAQHQLPIELPPDFPQNTLPTMRLLRVLKDELSDDKFTDATRHYWVNGETTNDEPSLQAEYFIRNTSTSDPSFLPSLPSTVMPARDLARCITKSQEKDISNLIRSEVAEIVEKYGTYGLPWIVVQRPKDGEVAWWFGSDRFHNIAWWLGEDEYPWNGPFPANKSKL